MRNLHNLITICLLLTASQLAAQNYIPLTLDSFYNHSLSPSLTTWGSFSYNVDDSIIQYRGKSFRLNYSYLQDTTFLTTEFPENNDWVIKSRDKEVYSNKKQVYKLTESLNNGIWENSARHFWFYNMNQLDSVYIIQHWINGIWQDYSKKEFTYTANNDLSEEAEYRPGVNTGFQYYKGKRWKYDNTHHRIEEINLYTTNTGTHYQDRMNWVYGNDNLLDTFSRCSYDLDTACKNVSLSVYTYYGDSSEQRIFAWMNNQWKYINNKVSFAGPGIYSNKPDSIYYNWPDSASNIPTDKEFLRYEETGNGKIYFRHEKIRFNPLTLEWKLVWINEEWYHLKPTVKTHESIDNQTDIVAYPNPCRPGNMVHIKNFTDNDQVSEFLIFNQEGRLIKSARPMPDGTFTVPEKAGVYSILIRNKSGVSGLFRLVVVE